MNIILYLIIFIMGITFGSFCTLAVYRIPRKENISHKRSYCPNCQHKLSFLDLIPVFSYLFLKGKCRYCKEKIRPRYLIIEALSGIVFLMFAVLLNIDLLNIEYIKIITLIFGIMFFSAIFIEFGIFKEYKKIQTSVFNFGIIVEIAYMVYLYILNTSIYRYVIYVLLLILMAIINNLKKTAELTKIVGFIIFILIGITEISIIIL